MAVGGFFVVTYFVDGRRAARNRGARRGRKPVLVPGFWLGPKRSARGYRLHGFDRSARPAPKRLEAAAAGDVGDIWFAALQADRGQGPARPRVGDAARQSRRQPADRARLRSRHRRNARLRRRRRAQPRARAMLPGARSVRHRAPTAQRPHRAQVAQRRARRTAPSSPASCSRRRSAPTAAIAVVIGFGVNIVAAPAGPALPGDVDRRAWASSSSAETAVRRARGRMGRRCRALGQRPWRRRHPRALARARPPASAPKWPSARDGDVVRGIFETIDDAGRLIVRANDNSRIAITAGDVHFGVTATARALMAMARVTSSFSCRWAASARSA